MIMEGKKGRKNMMSLKEEKRWGWSNLRCK